MFLLVMVWISWPLVFDSGRRRHRRLVYSYVIQHKMHELSETTYRATALRNATLIESLTALETIKAQNAEGQMQAKWERPTPSSPAAACELRLLSSSAMNGCGHAVHAVRQPRAVSPACT
jgi:ATP-binding cassette subfamily C protein LapB